ncbi:hypothetical protein HU200_015079 [Digitaria exilis]|uniref:Reverse transcriptase zinc-binding domain-containing protein n=1 Tax=Digitaria exilis TaxID=1010633 RepID=A0A835F9D8_9POAL|nr:hypothetical protein HU200_015079 [Digitaria exilis]
MFNNSIEVSLGNWHLALFWMDRWLGSASPKSTAPELCKLIKPAIKRSMTVAQALANRTWTRNIRGCLSITAIREFIQLWHATDQCVLQLTVEDTICWKWSASATYSARSAYRAFFEGSTRFAAAKPLWKAWAPLKVKFTIWLALRGRLWTSDRRYRHGLQDSPICSLCSQEPETCNHLFLECSYSKQIWHWVAMKLGLHPHLAAGRTATLLDWWLQSRRRWGNGAQKGFDSTILLVTWRIWKLRNNCVFRSTSLTVAEAFQGVCDEAEQWVQAGAKNLAEIGWLGTPIT